MSRRSNADAHFQNNLYAFWINVPPGECASAGIGALEQMLRVGALFVVPADRFDTSSYSKSAPPEIADNRPKYSEKLGAQGQSRIVVRDHPHRTQKLVSLLEAQPLFEHHRLFPRMVCSRAATTAASSPLRSRSRTSVGRNSYQ